RNVLGVSVQLCVLPWLGFVPDEVGSAPEAAVARLAAGLGIPAGELCGYGERAQTRTDHLREIVRYLGWRPAGMPEWKELDTQQPDNALGCLLGHGRHDQQLIGDPLDRWATRTRPVGQAGHPLSVEPAPPRADGVLTDPQVAGDLRVGLPPPRRQHDLGAQHQTLRRRGPGHDRFQPRSTARPQDDDVVAAGPCHPTSPPDRLDQWVPRVPRR
ncbi:MAG: DUF4158 domain-containing protein, partial [Pseudonocardiaceae bacterium]